MNVFFEHEAIYGKPETAFLRRTGEEWIALATSIRKRLGNQAYLLDNYLGDLLSALNEIMLSNCLYEAERTVVSLRRLCLSILESKEDCNEHPFYKRAKEYIGSHPLQFQEQITMHNLYCIALFDEFVEQQVKKQEEGFRREIQKAWEVVHSRDLYRHICNRLGSETEIEKLNLLVRQRFLIVSPMNVYLQSLTSELIFMLTSVDAETGKIVLRLWLDMRESSA